MRTFCSHLLFVSLLLLAPRAFAEWDPAQLAEAKNQAESAYEAGQYADAARAYIEFRSSLKSALANSEVPEELVGSVQEALIATAYQLGRSNQLSGNCQGAVTVFGELAQETAVSPLLALRAKAREAESHLCLAQQAADTREYLQAREAVGSARQSLAVLEVLMADSTEPPTEEISTLQFEVTVAVDTMERSIGDELGRAIHDDLARERCPSALQLIDFAEAHFPGHAGGWEASRKRYRDVCVNMVHEKPKKDPDPTPADTSSLDWEPMLLTGLGGATLVAAVIADAIVASQLDDYENILETCRAGVVHRCQDAQQQYEDVKGLPDVVLGLYIAGGVVTVGGALWWLFAATADDAPSTDPRLSVAPFGDGALSTLTWTF